MLSLARPMSRRLRSAPAAHRHRRGRHEPCVCVTRIRDADPSRVCVTRIREAPRRAQLYYHDCSGIRSIRSRSRHKGATGRVRTGDRRYPALCHCRLGQDIPWHIFVICIPKSYRLHIWYGITIKRACANFAWKRRLPFAFADLDIA